MTLPEVKSQIYSTNCTKSAISREKRTNADRIREMSDKELTEWIYRIHLEAFKHGRNFDEAEKHEGPKFPNYIDWLEWLKQEATDEYP